MIFYVFIIIRRIIKCYYFIISMNCVQVKTYAACVETSVMTIRRQGTQHLTDSPPPANYYMPALSGL